MSPNRDRFHRVARRAARWTSDRLGISEQFERSASRALSTTAGVGKYFPNRSGDHSVLWRVDRIGPYDEATLPVPPPKLWMCFEGDEREYRERGAHDVEVMLRLLSAAGYEPAPGDQILDFGCAAGRMTRWLAEWADRCEVWGTDIQETHVDWCRQHLTPPFRFFVSTTFPHLPWPDDSFRLVYAGSVFTNLAELADSWLLELRRVIAPGGFLYLTLHDRHSVDVIRSLPPGHTLRFLAEQLEQLDANEPVLDGPWDIVTLHGTAFSTQVFHDIDAFRERWHPLFDVSVVEQDAYLFQTGIVLCRRG
jgi:SAM-dependent methyltransferase